MYNPYEEKKKELESMLNLVKLLFPRITIRELFQHRAEFEYAFTDALSQGYTESSLPAILIERFKGRISGT